MYSYAGNRVRERLFARLASLAFAFFLSASALSGALDASAPVLAVSAAAAPEFSVRNYGIQRIEPIVKTVLCDDTAYSDEIEIVSEGRNGVFVDKYSDVYLGDTLVKSEKVGVITLVEPEERVVRVGTIEGSRTASRGCYIWPVSGRITSNFGVRSGSVGSSDHQGIDIGVPYGTDVLAADSGDVIYAGWASGYGSFVKLLHDSGDVSCYAHLSKITVSLGERVLQGEKLGEVGSTGTSSGPHLHFELRPGGRKAANPLDYLPEEY